MAWVAALLGCAGGCVDRAVPSLSGAPRNDADGLASLPTALHGEVGNVVAMRGRSEATTDVVPGQVVALRYGFVVNVAAPQVVPQLALVGDAGTADYVPIASATLRVDVPPHQWRAGDAIVDDLLIAIPSDWSSRTATLTWGLVSRVAGERGRLLSVTGGETHGGSLVLARWQVEASARVPRGVTPLAFVAQAPMIDGRDEEPAWASAPAVNFSTAEDSPAPSGPTSAKLLWDHDNLYVFVDVKDVDISTPFRQRDESLWQADVVEVFIDTDQNQRDYVELQISPAGVMFDSHFPGGRTDTSTPAWNSAMQAAVMVDGTLNQGGDQDRGYRVEVAIPWRDVKASAPAFVATAGAQLALNVVRVDHVAGKPAAASWRRISYRDFHGLDRLLPVVLMSP
ncbi:MAG: carbohydrate-binding family 9-like protein [Myxococcales bacterium]|nr:carbohydrate-binding family 9-like protein [Myxococcales bacterium]